MSEPNSPAAAHIEERLTVLNGQAVQRLMAATSISGDIVRLPRTRFFPRFSRTGARNFPVFPDDALTYRPLKKCKK